MKPSVIVRLLGVLIVVVIVATFFIESIKLDLAVSAGGILVGIALFIIGSWMSSTAKKMAQKKQERAEKKAQK